MADNFDLEAVKAEMAQRIIDNVPTMQRAFGYMPDSITPPGCGIAPAPGGFLQYDDAISSNLADVMFAVTIAVSAAQDRTGQKDLDAFLKPTGATSLRAALNSHAYTSCDYARVMGASDYGMIQWPNGQLYFGCRLMVAVKTS